MNRPAKHPSADLTQPLEWRRGMPCYNGKLLHYDYVAARLAASEKEITELQQKLALLEAGGREMVLELARQRGTITALKEACRDYARHSD